MFSSRTGQCLWMEYVDSVFVVVAGLDCRPSPVHSLARDHCPLDRYSSWKDNKWSHLFPSRSTALVVHWQRLDGTFEQVDRHHVCLRRECDRIHRLNEWEKEEEDHQDNIFFKDFIIIIFIFPLIAVIVVWWDANLCTILLQISQIGEIILWNTIAARINNTTVTSISPTGLDLQCFWFL